MLKITNTLTGEKENFVPRQSDRVSLYVCGVTPYAASHVGHGRCYVVFDVLYRTLRFLGYEVAYCRNFTDVDDKLINRAAETHGDRLAYGKIADKQIKAYRDAMQALGCLAPQYEPRVTEHMTEIIAFVEALVRAERAYVVEGDVYFEVNKSPGYPILSRHNLEDLRAGARVEVSEKKRDPLDFALWKHEPAGGFWDSPWGNGRPGWHIECSALAAHYLGEQIDIHGGGMDLIFPHHDNEIAQSEAHYGKPLARYWMHNALVRLGQEKMSKSLGNTRDLHELFKDHDPMVVRFYFLNHHYRSPLEFSVDGLEVARKSYQRIIRALDDTKTELISPEQVRESDIVKKMVQFLCDDLNTVGMLGVLFDALSSLSSDKQARSVVKLFLQEVMGVSLEPLAEAAVAITPEIELLLQARAAARENKDWARADEIRDKLQSFGVEVQDKPTK